MTPDNDPEDVNESLEELFLQLYADLRKMARKLMENERINHTLSATALVHDAYLKMVNATEQQQKSAAQFRAVIATAMRNILIDYARNKNTAKRGKDSVRVNWEAAEPFLAAKTREMIEVHEALVDLEETDSEAAMVVTLKYFFGMTYVEIAEVMGRSEATVRNRWKFARAWLYAKISSWREQM